MNLLAELILLFIFTGAVRYQFYLDSNRYISERFIKKVDTLTSSIMENGLYQFFVRISDFKRKFILRDDSSDDDDDTEVLTIQQLKRPMILVFCLWSAAIFIFIAEIIVSKYRQMT